MFFKINATLLSYLTAKSFEPTSTHKHTCSTFHVDESIQSLCRKKILKVCIDWSCWVRFESWKIKCYLDRQEKPFSYGIPQTVFLGTVTNTNNKRKRTYSAEICILDGKCWPKWVLWNDFVWFCIIYLTPPTMQKMNLASSNYWLITRMEISAKKRS